MSTDERIKARLVWGRNKAWYGRDAERGFFLKKDAPPEAVASFKLWAAHQDELGEEGFKYTLAVI